MYNCQFSIM